MAYIQVAQILKGIWAIGPIETATQSTSNSKFLVVGERCAIIEPGEDGQMPAFLEGVKDLDVDLERIDYIIPTHIHTHHVAAANVLLKELPHAKLVVHQRAVPHVIDPTRLNEDTTRIWGEGVCAILKPVPEDKIIGVTGGEVFDLGGRELEIIDARGHAPHHIAIFDRLTRAVWAGDLVAFSARHNKGRCEMAPPLFDVEKSVDALRRVQALKPSVLLDWQTPIAHYSPDDVLQSAIEENLTVEQIVLEGMQQKLTAREIAVKVQAYHRERDLLGLGLEQIPQQREESRERGPVALYRYLLRKYPDLEMPEGAVRSGAQMDLPRRG